MLGGSVLNATGLNASARGLILSAACLLVATTQVAAEPTVTRFAGSTIDAGAYADSSAQVCRCAQAEIALGVSIIAAHSIRYAESSTDVAAHATMVADALVTKVPDVAASATATLAAAALQRHQAGSTLPCASDLGATAIAVFASQADVVAGAAVYAGGVRVVLTEATSLFDSTIHAAARTGRGGEAHAAGTAALDADVGFVVPATAVAPTISAVYARARLTHYLDLDMEARSILGARATVYGYGEVSVLAQASVSAATVDKLGNAAISSDASISANPHYLWRASSAIEGHCGALLSTDAGVVDRRAYADVGPHCHVRVEPSLNNEHFAYCFVAARSTTTDVAQGVVSAPRAAHAYSWAHVESTATYAHRVGTRKQVSSALVHAGATRSVYASGATQCAATLAADATYVYPAGSAIYFGRARAWASPRMNMKSGALVRCQAHNTASPYTTHRPRAPVRATAVAIPAATRTAFGATPAVFSGVSVRAQPDKYAMASGSASCVASAQSYALRTVYGGALMDSQAAVQVAATRQVIPAANLTADARMTPSADRIVFGGAHADAQGTLSGSSVRTVFPQANQVGTCATAATSICTFYAGAFASGHADTDARLHHRHLPAADAHTNAYTTTLGTRVVLGTTSVLARLSATAEGSYYFAGVADILAGSTLAATPFRAGNAVAEDPDSRTMYRTGSIRVMYRPFVDRIMRAPTS